MNEDGRWEHDGRRGSTRIDVFNFSVRIFLFRSNIFFRFSPFFDQLSSRRILCGLVPCTMAGATPSSFSLCPFSFQAIDTIHPEDESNPLLNEAEERNRLKCGHSCTLSNLVSYLHDHEHHGGTKLLCPVCQSSSASFICDKASSSYISRRTSSQHVMDGSDSSTDDGNSGGRIVSFRYGTNVYFLWVASPPQLSSSYTTLFHGRNGGNALNRIAQVLRVDIKNGMKVIHKGKIIYPHSGKNSVSSHNNSMNDISEQLLDISASDIIHRRKKPSLVVMGLRINTSDMRRNTTPLSDVIFSVTRQITPWYIWNNMVCGFRWTFRSFSSLLGGVWVFFRSILFPPQI